ncbi:hypothetical protein M9Y10_007856 [Tritrichomonas musculus]|uniref:Uncharacterized protein n=1 Tax=Tritrichomonas musculus TaxID=1915356 RepID=A0ABR2J2H8_9EUKA
MGRRGHEWKKIRAFTVITDDQIITIELDSDEKIINENNILDEIKISSKPEKKENQSIEKILQNESFNDITFMADENLSLLNNSLFDDKNDILQIKIPEEPYILDDLFIDSNPKSLFDNNDN